MNFEQDNMLVHASLSEHTQGVQRKPKVQQNCSCAGTNIWRTGGPGLTWSDILTNLDQTVINNFTLKKLQDEQLAFSK